MKKYNYKDNFEMLYLRHEYLTKGKGRLEGKHIEKYKHIINITARIMYNKLYPNFNKVGFDLDDIVAITNVYTLGYMNMYSIKNNTKEFNRYIQKYHKKFGNQTFPSSQEIDHTERDHLINFLRQRLQHCSTLCNRKAKNIIVNKDKREIFAETNKSESTTEENILKDWKRYGYRKVTQKELKEIKKIAKKSKTSELKDKNGFSIIEIERLNNNINYEDYTLIHPINEGDYFFTTPEKYLIYKEEDKIFNQNKETFDNLDIISKQQRLIEFIQNNKENLYLKKELSCARKMLKSLKKESALMKKNKKNNK